MPDKLTTSLGKLDISSKTKESWDAEDDSSDDGSSTPIRQSSSSQPGAPPPTPSSPSFSSSKTAAGAPYQTFPPFGFDGYGEGEDVRGQAGKTDAGECRPEKSTAVASRLIAAGIGQKAPRRTQEQREYDQAMKVQEKKKRDQVKADEERRRVEKEKAKQAIWDD